MKNWKRIFSLIDTATQIVLPTLTILGFTFIALKQPQIGLIFNLLAQIFWLYAGWQAWKKANQIGIFITAVIITLVVLYGILNYWLIH